MITHYALISSLFRDITQIKQLFGEPFFQE